MTTQAWLKAEAAAVAEDVRGAGRDVLLGPALDIVRTPLGGRAAESFGEDAHLAGVMTAAYVPAAPPRAATSTFPRSRTAGTRPPMPCNRLSRRDRPA
jgi:beta-glucosidase